MGNKETAMPTERENRQERLFTLRLWTEEMAEDQHEWRGRIFDATTGDVRYFRDWASLIPLLLAMLRDAEQGSTTRLAPPPHPTGADT
jgi:hypothetical protein